MEFHENFDTGPVGAVVSTSNTEMHRVLSNGTGSPALFVADSRSGLAIKRAVTSGTVQLGYGLPGATFSSTSQTNVNIEGLVDPPTGVLISSVWCKVDDVAVAGSDVIYLETQNVAAWNDTEYVVDYTYDDWEAIGIGFAREGYAGWGHGGIGPLAEPGQNAWIHWHGPEWNTDQWDETTSHHFGTVPMGEWLKCEIHYDMTGRCRGVIYNEAEEILVDSGWSEGWPSNPANPAPDGWRPAAVWLRGRSNVTIDDFSASLVAPEPEPEPEPEEIVTRPHYHRPVRTADGALVTNAIVSLYRPGTEQLVSEQVFLGPTGIAERSPRWHSSDGEVDFYVNQPGVVDIHISPLPVGDLIIWRNQWVGDAENIVLGDAPNPGDPWSLDLTDYVNPDLP